MTRLTSSVMVVTAACLAGLSGRAAGQITPAETGVDLVPVVTSGLNAPIFMTGSGDGSGRLFIVDQTGKILVVKNGVVLPTPFLDLTSQIVAVNPGFDERGVLGLAFHPDYASNGRFFVRWSRPRAGQAGEPCFGTTRGCHDEVLSEFHVSAGDPDVADPNGTVLLAVSEPQFNHNGGQIMFGPDGFLYISLGDGGGAHDGLADNPPSHGPIGNGQNLETLLGKMLRIDVDTGAPYSIPADNPFAGVAGLDEIWAYGLRNPYRFSFDDAPGGDGDLWCGDVGQNLTEEIDLITPGGNFGWVIKEGSHCFDPFNPTVPPAMCNDTGMIDPIAEYEHADGLAVVGGFVYRGSGVPDLAGMYVFGDWSKDFVTAQGRLFMLDPADPAEIRELLVGAKGVALGRYLLGIGRGDDGELYVGTSTSFSPTSGTGAVYRVVGRCSADCDQSTGVGELDFFDFICFQDSFAAQEPYACDCDTSTGQATCDFFDFICFQDQFSLGC